MADSELQHTKRLLTVMQQLRHPIEGCPWDVKQTMKSLVKYTLEEAYEVADAVLRGDRVDIQDELGDLLFQVVFYAQIAAEEQAFNFDDVAGHVADKLIERHPHVFDKSATVGLTDEQLQQQWQQIKQRQKRRKNNNADDNSSIFADLNHGLPAMKRALALQKACAKVGFDWSEITPVLNKVSEETNELRAEVTHPQPDSQRVEEEFGDLLFAVINVARHLSIDPEVALHKANVKFETRFKKIEKKVAESGKPLDQHSLDALEALWQQAKQ